MSLISFPTQLQFIPYTGPPKSKQTSRCNPPKTAFNGHKDLAPASPQAGDVNSTIIGDNICKLEDFGSECGDISCTGGSPHPDKQGAEFGSFLSMSYPENILRRGSSGLPALKDSSQERVIVIEDSKSELDANNGKEGYSHSLKSSTQPYDGVSVTDFSTEDKTEDKDSAISSELDDGLEFQASGLPRCEPTLLIPPTRSSAKETGNSTQEARGNTLPEATMDQSQHLVHKKPEVQNKYTPLVMTSSCSSSNSSDSNDDNDNNNSTNSTRQPHKRKRSLPSKRRALNTQTCGTDSKKCCGDDSSDSSSESRECGNRVESNKRRKSALWPYRSRSRDRADEDGEYEVERILEARVYCRKLQYRVKWLGYKDDRTWYDASNFKNSPYKLRDFHLADITWPGPPKRLGRWIECWEEDRDADDHPDDNKF